MRVAKNATSSGSACERTPAREVPLVLVPSSLRAVFGASVEACDSRSPPPPPDEGSWSSRSVFPCRSDRVHSARPRASRGLSKIPEALQSSKFQVLTVRSPTLPVSWDPFSPTPQHRFFLTCPPRKRKLAIVFFGDSPERTPIPSSRSCSPKRRAHCRAHPRHRRARLRRQGLCRDESAGCRKRCGTAHPQPLQSLRLQGRPLHRGPRAWNPSDPRPPHRRERPPGFGARSADRADCRVVGAAPERLAARAA